MLRLGVERGIRQWLPQPPIESRSGQQKIGDEIVRPGAHESHALQVIGQAYARNAPRRLEQPPRHAAGVGPEVPALAARDVEKRVTRFRLADQRAPRADRVEIGYRRLVARDQQVVAVVDAATQRRVEIGAATSARLRRRFVDGDADPCLAQPQRGGEAGQSGADDMDVGGPRHIRP